ncbi:MAG: hypothetical protein LBI04_07865 [Treponema sp.]|jgi:hypothetical protein|nr:hypothetical protein [Treponema sp.]
MKNNLMKLKKSLNGAVILTGILMTLFLAACSSPDLDNLLSSGNPDLSNPDSGNPDSGNPDSGNPDSGDPDSGDPDSGDPDSGNPDSGDPDSGDPDSGDPDSGDPDGEDEPDFPGFDPFVIYNGGARKGITIAGLEDDLRFFAESVNMEAEEAGYNGNQRVIKISHALNAGGNTVQQSFGLFSDEEIDLEEAAALSFWARANKKLDIRYVGFGDADPDKRVVYTGEDFNQQISVSTEWKRYIVPVPAGLSGLKMTRVFILNVQLAKENYICIDNIEFIKSGVTVTDIIIPSANDELFYGAVDAVNLLKGAQIKITYLYSDGAVTTLQYKENNHTLKYNLANWLSPFIGINGNVTFNGKVIYPLEKASSNQVELSVSIDGITSNSMTASVIGGILLDNFEDTGGVTIPATPASDSGYLWHTSASGSVVTVRDDFTVSSDIIHSGIGSGSWRPLANANVRGGRNFEAKDATGYNTLTFYLKVTTGTGDKTSIYKDINFNFELKNGGTLANKTNGSFFPQQFTYNTDGWQKVKIKLADFINAGLDITAITGYAFGVAEKHGVSLRIMLDDIALVYEADNEI